MFPDLCPFERLFDGEYQLCSFSFYSVFQLFGALTYRVHLRICVCISVWLSKCALHNLLLVILISSSITRVPSFLPLFPPWVYVVVLMLVRGQLPQTHITCQRASGTAAPRHSGLKSVPYVIANCLESLGAAFKKYMFLPTAAYSQLCLPFRSDLL